MPTACSGRQTKPSDLNYPSFSAVFDQSTLNLLTTTFARTVTNVGPAKSIYRATVVAPEGVEIAVTPIVLTFQEVNERQSFILTVSAHGATLLPGDSETVFGLLSWTDGRRTVQSPIALFSKSFRFAADSSQASIAETSLPHLVLLKKLEIVLVVLLQC